MCITSSPGSPVAHCMPRVLTHLLLPTAGGYFQKMRPITPWLWTPDRKPPIYRGLPPRAPYSAGSGPFLYKPYLNRLKILSNFLKNIQGLTCLIRSRRHPLQSLSRGTLIAGVDSGGPFAVVPGPSSEKNRSLPSPIKATRLSPKANGVTKRCIVSSFFSQYGFNPLTVNFRFSRCAEFLCLEISNTTPFLSHAPTIFFNIKTASLPCFVWMRTSPLHKTLRNLNPTIILSLYN